MSILFRLFFALALSLGLFTFTPAATAGPTPVIAEGQVWAYQTRPHEPASRIVVLHVYQPPKGERVAYVAITGATIRLDGRTPVAWTFCSFPLTESALRESLRTLENERAPQAFPELEKKYAGWKKQADGGNVQFWTKPVATTLDELEVRIRKARPS